MAVSRRLTRRYTAVAITFHWLIALAIVTIAMIGLVMAHVKLTPLMQFKLFQLHKSIGITILALTVLRLLWRLTHRPPALPTDMPKLERRAAEGTHVMLYVLMLGLPLIGWALVSASPLNLPTVLYGVVPWPHLPMPPGISKATLAPILTRVHAYGAYILIGLFALHAAAALRHHLVIRDDVLRRMIPGLPQPKRSP